MSGPISDHLDDLAAYRRLASRVGRGAGTDADVQALVSTSRTVLAGKKRGILRILVRALVAFPQHIRVLRGPIVLATSLFLFGVAFGAIAVQTDSEAASLLLPTAVFDAAVTHPAGEARWLYQQDPAQTAALSGTLLVHNVTTAFSAIAFGCLWGIGAALAMLKNGVFLGALAMLVEQRGISDVFWSFVGPHGALEFPLVCISGGAGLALGRCLFFRDKEARRRALAETVPAAAGVTLALLPLLGIAALLEGQRAVLPSSPLESTALTAAILAAVGLYVFGPLSRPKSTTAPS